MYRFEKLRVYQHSMEFVSDIYKLTKLLPEDERFGLTSQIRRSAISIVLNIAECSGGLGDREYKSFLRIALKSLYETVASLKISNMLYKTKIDKLLEYCNLIGKELNALIKSLKTKE